MDNTLPPKKHKWFFWMILGAFSTFFAEVFAGSDMFPFFNIWGILVVWPLYGLHTLIFTTIIFRYGKPNLSTLVFSGMLFGLYEAYMTKVLWQPDWDTLWQVGGVAVFEVFVLVFWWHTWLSFIVPLILSERLLTTSQDVLSGLKGKVYQFFMGWKGYLILFVFGAIFQSINSPSVGHSILSGVSTVGFLFFLTWAWRRVTREQSYTLAELLPNNKEFMFLGIWLGIFYLFMGVAIKPERIPGVVGQGIIIALYTGLIVLLVLALHKSSKETHPVVGAPPIAPRYWFIIWLVFVFGLGLAKILLVSFVGFIVLASWFSLGILGIVLFVMAVRNLREPHQ